jgi:hypothetical protein
MDYFTLLIITVLSGPLEGSTAGLIYDNLAECEAAINTVTDTLTYDYKVKCEETDLPSASIRPIGNPNYEDNNG